jgi:dolichol-phosphate mannosyltransferase
MIPPDYLRSALATHFWKSNEASQRGAPGMNASNSPFSSEELKQPRSKYVCVIPVKNEGARLHRQLERMCCAELREMHGIDVIIADSPSTDGSTDPSTLADYGVTAIVRGDNNVGLSNSLRAAFLYCMSKGYTSIILMDGNEKDEPRFLPKFVDKLNDGYDFIQGSRFLEPNGESRTPRHRKFLIRFVHAPFFSLLAGKAFTDTTNGYRGFSARYLNSAVLNLKQNLMQKYELPYYLSWLACRAGFRVIEIPVIRVYPKTGPIPTKIVGLSAHWQMLKPLLLLATRTLLGAWRRPCS